MGKTILTSTQHNFLELASQEDEIVNWYYLTGGTALSEFYLHHRLSEDIDLFTESEVNDPEIDKIIQKFVKLSKADKFEKRRISGLFIYEIFLGEERLKIDFNNFPYTSVERGIFYKKLRVDSFYDIAINKAYTILGRFQMRDFIDLYFILQKEEFSLEQLMDRITDKYKTQIDPLYLSSQFLRVIDLPRAYPKMLVPFEFTDMVEFFKQTARRLGKKSIN